MGRFMFVIFQILIPILLLNMLIAMMGNTYAIVNEKSEKEFLKQVRPSPDSSTHASILYTLENFRKGGVPPLLAYCGLLMTGHLTQGFIKEIQK